MRLYEEILFLKHYFNGKWVSENVKPFYTPLIQGKEIGRHLFWSNFPIGNYKSEEADIKDGNIGDWQKLHGFDISKYKFNQRKDKILRNCVHPETGLYILDCARNIIRKEDTTQTTIFD